MMETKPFRRIIGIASTQGDGEMDDKINFLKNALGNLKESYLHDRLFIVLDQKNSTKKKRLESKGVKSENIIVWNKNGIEYYYPIFLLKSIFRIGDIDENDITTNGNNVIIKDVQKTKKELAQEVSAEITTKGLRGDDFNEEFKQKLLVPINLLLNQP